MMTMTRVIMINNSMKIIEATITKGVLKRKSLVTNMTLNRRNSYRQRIQIITPLKLHDDMMRWGLVHLLPGGSAIKSHRGQLCRPLGSALTLGNDDHSDDDDDSMINNDDGDDNDKKRSRRKINIRWQFSKKGATWKHDFVDITHWLSINVPSQTCTPWKLSENYQ